MYVCLKAKENSNVQHAIILLCSNEIFDQEFDDKTTAQVKSKIKVS